MAVGDRGGDRRGGGLHLADVEALVLRAHPPDPEEVLLQVGVLHGVPASPHRRAQALAAAKVSVVGADQYGLSGHQRDDAAVAAAPGGHVTLVGSPPVSRFLLLLVRGRHEEPLHDVRRVLLLQRHHAAQLHVRALPHLRVRGHGLDGDGWRRTQRRRRLVRRSAPGKGKKCSIAYIYRHNKLHYSLTDLRSIHNYPDFGTSKYIGYLPEG